MVPWLDCGVSAMLTAYRSVQIQSRELEIQDLLRNLACPRLSRQSALRHSLSYDAQGVKVETSMRTSNFTQWRENVTLCDTSSNDLLVSRWHLVHPLPKCVDSA
jgi:hypothetical protein